MIPREVQDVLQKLNEAGFEGFLVGGCVRDMLLGKVPHDWDITTSALPGARRLLSEMVAEGTIVTDGGKRNRIYKLRA